MSTVTRINTPRNVELDALLCLNEYEWDDVIFQHGHYYLNPPSGLIGCWDEVHDIITYLERQLNIMIRDKTL